MAEISESQP